MQPFPTGTATSRQRRLGAAQEPQLATAEHKKPINLQANVGIYPSRLKSQRAKRDLDLLSRVLRERVACLTTLNAQLFVLAGDSASEKYAAQMSLAAA